MLFQRKLFFHENQRRIGVMSQEAKAKEPHFTIQRIYIKDLSFESPSSPEVFQAPWDPQMNVDLDSKAQKYDTVYEVVLHVTVTVKQGDKIAFIAELQQGGMFSIEGLENDVLDHALHSYAPAILFPYAREVLTDLVMRGGFPQMILAPVNFDVIYQARKQKEVEKV
jgi:preprotein translocase subunit SecB